MAEMMTQKGGSEDVFVPQEKPSEVTLLTPHLPASGLTSKLRGAGHSHPVLRSTCPRLPGFPKPAIVTKKRKKNLEGMYIRQLLLSVFYGVLPQFEYVKALSCLIQRFPAQFGGITQFDTSGW